MVIINRVTIVFIMVLFFSAFIFPQEKHADTEKKLRKEILAVYQSKGEQGLRDFFQKQKDKITNKFIVDFAEAGLRERKEKWLKVCEIMAEEKKDQKNLADVLYYTGEYFRVVSDYKKAYDYFEKAFPIYKKSNDLVGQGNVYMNKGDIYSAISENIKASEMFNKALIFFEKAGDIINQGNVYKKKGDIHFYIDDFSKALMMYDKALQFFEKKGYFQGKGNVYIKKGEIHFHSGENSLALEMFDTALDIFKKTGDLLGQAHIYWCKGDSYYYNGNSSMALEMYAKALYFYKKMKSLLGQANVYKGQGNVYMHTGDNSKALKMYVRALYFFEKVGDLLGQGNVYQSTGDIFFIKGDNSKAKEMYDMALYFYEKAKSLISLGSIYQKKGDIFSNSGDKAKALAMYDRALDFSEKAVYPRLQGYVYYQKGEIYLKSGDNSWAQKMFNKALLIFEKIGSLEGQGYVYLRKGDINFWKGDNLKALEMYEKALPFFEKEGDILGQGNLFLNLGDIYLETANNSKALVMYEKALTFFKKNDSLFGEGNVYLSKGKFYFKNGDSSKAIEMYDKALEIYKKIGIIEAEYLVLHLKANIVAQKGKKIDALALYEKAIFNLEKVRKKTVFSEMKKSFMEKVYQQYEETVLFVLENKYYKKSFKYTESMKSRVFLDRMAEELVRLEKGLTPELKERRDNMMAKLSTLNKQIYEAPGGEDEKKLKELKEQYRKTEDEFDELLIKIRLENPLYASVRYPQPISVQKLQKEVLKKGEILMRYFISPDKLYVFLISKKKFKVVSLDVKEKEIAGLVEHYLDAVKENDPIRMRRYGKTLYKRLFKPLEKRIKNSKDIIIVPDGKLATIPFESLILDSRGQDRPVFLLEKYKINYIQSASLLSTLRKHYRRESKTKKFIGFGDPVYDYENFKQGIPEHGAPHPAKGDEIKEIHRGKYDREGGKMARLKDSGQEVNTIAEFFKKQRSENCVVHMREKATEENAKAPHLKEFDYIHFSCHGILGDTFQSLVLSQDIPGAKDDGYFTLNEIMNCDYNAKLVVLSACQTGSGKLERAEGVTGLTRAVMYAGTPAVLASLWKVDDIATKELMINFYQNMLEKNMNKVEALRQAKLELIKNKKYSPPFFWSAFVMYGE